LNLETRKPGNIESPITPSLSSWIPGFQIFISREAEGRLRFRKRLHFDGDKPNSVVRQLPDVMIIYLSSLA
jgi:hypothetical protein